MGKDIQDALKQVQKAHQKKEENTNDLFDQLKRIEEKLDKLLEIIEK